MTIQEAFQELIDSDEFNNKAKEKTTIGSKYRVMRSRFRKGELDILAMFNLLIKHDYEVTVKKKNA